METVGLVFFAAFNTERVLDQNYAICQGLGAKYDKEH